LNSWSTQENELTEKKFDLGSSWPQTLPDDQRAVAEVLPLRRDVITLLTYLRDNRVTGTKSTGNLPLKAVHEICARFVNPPKLEVIVDEYVYRVRTETDVWPLLFRHVLVSVGGLVIGGLGRRWKLTLLGERFLAEPATQQVWLLLVTWWVQTNWAIASPYDFEDGYLAAGFSRLTLEHLLNLSMGESVSFEYFTDRIIEDLRMVWPDEDLDRACRILRSIIERLVINPLIDFGILQTEYEPHKTLGAEFRELSAFLITPFGRSLLQALKDTMKPE
jgi:hypothetical protein